MNVPINGPDILWQNRKSAMDDCYLQKFINLISSKYNKNFTDYHDFYLWSINYYQDFWQEFLVFSKIILAQNYDKVLQQSETFNLNRWFYNAKLNFAQNLLESDYNKERLTLEPDYPALIALNEQGNIVKYSLHQIKHQVAELISYFNLIGIQPGDRIVALIPNISQSVIAMLATTAVGAVWSACSPDFGETGVLERFEQIAPKIIITVDGYYYKNKYFSCVDKNYNIIKKLSCSLKSVICIDYINKNILDKHNLDAKFDIANWGSIVLKESQHNSHNKSCKQDVNIKYTAVDFNDPLYIMFSSGTTGKPKCIVHGVGGVLLEHYKEHLLHHNINHEDNFFYFTTTSWMMWHWHISAIGLGATVVIYDGAPNYPSDDYLLKIIDQQKITVFGASAKYYSSLEKANISSGSSKLSLDSLRMMLSTGSPLLAEQYYYIYNNIKSDLLLCSISGGTDILGCFALGNLLLPVYAGQLQTRSLGLDVRFYNDEGQEVIGEKAELVCLNPFPSMPIFFWGDLTKEKYHQAYFAKFNNIWAHGDYGELTPEKGVIIYGRSDAVLNPGGVRIGTAEIYAEVEKVSEVIESLAVGQSIDSDERIILFVVLRDNLLLNEGIRNKIISQIRHGASPRHVPAVIMQVPELPRTTSGKLVELAVKNIIAGQEVKNRDALANPWALDYIANLKVNLEELQQ